MLKQLACALALVGLFASGAMAAIPADVIWETNRPSGHHVLTIGVPTTVDIYIQARETGFGYAGGAFSNLANLATGLPNPAAVSAGLNFDLNGPDDVDFTADDGWIFQNGLGDQPNWIATVVPPDTLLDIPVSPFQLVPGERVLHATLEITATALGDLTINPVAEFFTQDFDDLAFVIGPGVTFFVPEPMTLVLLALGGLYTVRRRRS